VLTRFVCAVVRWSRLNPWIVLALALAITAIAGTYAANRLTITTDTAELFDPNLPFRKADAAYYELFPGESQSIVIVVDGPSTAAAEDGASKLAAALRAKTTLFTEVREPTGGAFFRKNGLLYLSPEQLQQVSTDLAAAQPLLGALAQDPSIRGFFALVSRGLDGAEAGEALANQLTPALNQATQVITAQTQGNPIRFDWAGTLSPSPDGTAARALLIAQPKLDFSTVGAGEDASAAIRKTAAALGLTRDAGYQVRLTGPTPLEDEEFATIEEGTKLSGLVSAVLVLTLLWLAVKTPRHVVAILIVLGMGLVCTFGWAALSVGRLNVISIAFAIMFVGIAVDFGIQLCLRYRDERTRAATAGEALDNAARKIAKAEAISTIAIAIGFFSFLPTDYLGVAELGVIAGGGIVIAFLLTISALPALVMVLRPPGDVEPPGFAWAAKPNAWLQENRRRMLIGAGVLTLAALAMLPRVTFDFDPLKLKDPTTESMATLNDLMGDPWSTPNTLSLMEADLAKADARAAALRKLPEVRDVLTLSNFVPEDQETKLFLIEDLAFLLGPSLQPSETALKPSPAALQASATALIARIDAFSKTPAATGALREAVDNLRAAIANAAPRLSDERFATQLDTALVGGFAPMQARLAESLQAGPVSVQDLPADVTRQWIASDGRYRLQVYPKAALGELGALERFATAVQGKAQDAVGPPILIVETGKVVQAAFVQAAGLAFVCIAALLMCILRNVRDVAMTLAPMVLAAIWTLGTIGLIGLPLTFANVIGMPLLLGIGVSFPVYLVALWRSGDDRLLQSAVARAVLFSAGTTLAAFGSLAISTHPGTAGLGILLSLALAFTLAATMIVLPALLGKAPAHTADSGLH
jgi:uncharacterized protein